MASDLESSAADVGGAADFAAGGLDKLSTEIGSAGAFDSTDIHDPQRLLEYKRQKIEADHEGVRGAAGSVESKLFGLPSYQGEMDTLSDAERYAATGDARSSAASLAQQERSRLRNLQQGLDTAVAEESKTEFQRQIDAVNQSYADQLEAADDVVHNHSYWSQGLHSRAEANQYAEHLKKSASALHDSALDSLNRKNLAGQEHDQVQLSILNREAAGDITGATRATLEMHLDDEENAIDPNDKQRLKNFAEISQKTMANFDAEVARQQKLQGEQVDDQIAQMHEKSKEAQLRAAGKSNEADVAQLQFETAEQVKSYQQQADAQADPARNKQYLQLAQAAQESGKEQLDALQKEQQRQNTQAPALNSAAHGGAALDDALATKLADAAKKLDDAATKLDRAIGGPNKSVTSVKD